MKTTHHCLSSLPERNRRHYPALIIGAICLALLIQPLSSFSQKTDGRKAVRTCYNFDLGWCLHIGDLKPEQLFTEQTDPVTAHDPEISLPRAFNENEAFSVPIAQLSDTVVWYYKTFRLPKNCRDKKVFIEFEGVRQAADVWLNGHYIGLHENGVMAFGFDLTPFIKKGQNKLAVRTDNSWTYRERGRKYARYQWNDRNFNANYGGIPKHVRLHVTGQVYQTLPLYSSLKTTGTYIYATDFNISGRKAIIHAESEVKNESQTPCQIYYEMEISDDDNQPVRFADGQTVSRSIPITIPAGESHVLRTEAEALNLHFWSWGYGRLYTVRTRLISNGQCIDEVTTRTGFRKTGFGKGQVWLNDRVIQLKGYAQRSSNEWPATGMSIPAWLSDYSNRLMVESGANLVRWMHVTPWKQDIESCDRVGLLQAMPAGDAERDVNDRRWEQRVSLMRDAIIYNRNNPSIIFYECGNKGISESHLLEMKALRDLYDPYGGRAVGSREMLDINTAEYGGEMLYINKSAKHPMWAMEYSRDEGLRKYRDNWSYPFHPNGEGPLYKNADASAYNLNQDMLAVEHVKRWYDYWRERPGTGRRVSSGGTKIIFSDTNTHSRGESNYRASGVTDAMRLPKESFYAHQVMWDGWVDVEHERTHIIGHWNYPEGTRKPIYVVSSAPQTEIYINGKLSGKGKREYAFLHTFDSIAYEPGTLIAVGRNAQGRITSSDTLQTAGKPYAIRLKVQTGPQGFFADGADMALIEVEVTDLEGRRCPTDNSIIQFQLEGPAEWRGGIATRPGIYQESKISSWKDLPVNFILSDSLPVECGVNRVLVRSLCKAGKITLKATSKGLQPATISWKSKAVKSRDGLTLFNPALYLRSNLDRGETPATPSFRNVKETITITHATAGTNQDKAALSIDDNERSEWNNNGQLADGWITYTFNQPSIAHEACLKLTGWRMRSYPLEIYADSTLVWSGLTEKSLGYVHLRLKPVLARQITIRLKGQVKEQEGFSQITELTIPSDGELDLYKTPNAEKNNNELRIVEAEFLHHLCPLDPDDRPNKMTTDADF